MVDIELLTSTAPASAVCYIIPLIFCCSVSGMNARDITISERIDPQACNEARALILFSASE
jgi:hypothetical protein